MREDILSIKSVRADGNGTLPAYAWPGGYPLFYVCEDGGILCAGDECANGKEAKDADPDDGQWLIVASDIHWEGDPLTCDHCGGSIESAYGPVEDTSEAR